MKEKCSKCGSEDVEKVNVIGADILICNACGYDESEELANPDAKAGRKGRNVYRTGGGRRSVAKK